jgi:phosphoglucosamine mutase
MGRLFGTDGIRGVANKYPMTAEMSVRIGRAVALIFKDKTGRSKIILGKDTRLSGHMFEYALVSGICSAGGDAYLTGTLPTPGIAFLTSSEKASAGIVISASHNPYYDNGIKIFNHDGLKLSDEKEAEIEKLVLDLNLNFSSASIPETGIAHHLNDAKINYSDFLKQTLPADRPLNGLKIVLDCANGATYQVAPELFSDLGADVESTGVHPDGKNINAGCGSEHPQGLIKKVLDNKADIGLAFDGDGDRLIAVDENGGILSGDHILAICAKVMKQQGTLLNDIVVSTVMSNMGLGIALKNMGIHHETSDVGDRYVMEKMIATGAVLGGEDSGHMIFSDHHTTGDGILTALRLIDAMLNENKPLSRLSKIINVYPQVLLNVDVQTKPDIQTVPEVAEEIKSVESKLGHKGRVLVRYSGTQPLCRIMVEGPDEKETKRFCQQIAKVVKAKLGTSEPMKS